ncbi:TPA: hypothetical protein ACHX5C_004699, partial [Shigella sonnei]
AYVVYVMCFCSFRLYHQECDGKQEKNDPGKQINNESNLITKCDNSDAKVLPPGYRYQLQRQ